MICSGKRGGWSRRVAVLLLLALVGGAGGGLAEAKGKSGGKRARVKVHKYSIVVKGKPKAIAKVTGNVACESGYRLKKHSKRAKAVLFACLKRGKKSEAAGKSCKAESGAKSHTVKSRKSGKKVCVYQKAPSLQKAALRSKKRGKKGATLAVKGPKLVKPTRAVAGSIRKPTATPVGVSAASVNSGATGQGAVEVAGTLVTTSVESAVSDSAASESEAETVEEAAMVEEEVVIEGDAESAAAAGEEATTSPDPDLAEFSPMEETELLAEFVDTNEGITDRELAEE